MNEIADITKIKQWMIDNSPKLSRYLSIALKDRQSIVDNLTTDVLLSQVQLVDQMMCLLYMQDILDQMQDMVDQFESGTEKENQKW